MHPMTSSRSTEPTPERPRNEELARFRKGELSLDEYLESRVETAVAHVRAALSEEQLEIVRDVVRETLKTDPSMLALVQQLASERQRTPVGKGY
jgi:hypothetical protein